MLTNNTRNGGETTKKFINCTGIQYKQDVCNIKKKKDYYKLVHIEDEKKKLFAYLKCFNKFSFAFLKKIIFSFHPTHA